MRRTEQKRTLSSDDYGHISYRYFSAEREESSSPTPTVIIYYRKKALYHDIEAFITALNLPGYTVIALDVAEYIDTVNPATPLSTAAAKSRCFQQFIDGICAEHEIQPQDIALLSHGDCATVMAAWITDYAPDIAAAVFYSPLFVFNYGDVLRFRLRNLVFHFPQNHQAGSNSSEKKGFALHTFSPFLETALSKTFSSAQLNDLLYTCKRIFRSAFSYPIPTQLVLSKYDREASCRASLAFYANTGSSVKSLVTEADKGYGCPQEWGQASAIHHTASFLKENFARRAVTPSLFNSYLQGATRDEYEKLRQPECNPLKKAYWGINKFVLKHIGKFSCGIRLGLETGFDSGASLDYIYENKSTGSNALGRVIDRYYLNNLGWCCTRLRKKHVEELSLLAIDLLSRAQKECRLLDIAAGHGRYIMNVLEKIPHPIAHILMRDYEQSNVENGIALIAEKKLGHLATFEQGDAFSESDLRTLPADRTLTIVSGFYELFSDNNLVLTSLKGIANATAAGGYLIYTTKLWNPKLAYMARVLPSHKKGEHWLLRRRTQREINQLVTEAGFVKQTQRLDPWGMFSVTLAKKAISVLP